MAVWHTNADLFHHWEEAEGRAAKWERTALQEREAHKQEVIICERNSVGRWHRCAERCSGRFRAEEKIDCCQKRK